MFGERVPSACYQKRRKRRMERCVISLSRVVAYMIPGAGLQLISEYEVRPAGLNALMRLPSQSRTSRRRFLDSASGTDEVMLPLLLRISVLSSGMPL